MTFRVKLGLRRVGFGVDQFSLLRSPGHRQRTGSGDRASPGEHWPQHEKLPGSGSQGNNPGEQKTTEGPPTRKARKRHLIESAPSTENSENSTERGAGKKAEQAKEEGKWDVGGAETDDEQENETR